MTQAAILFFSGLAVWLTTGKKQNRWGFIIGAAAQPLWMLETWQKGQWGMLLLSLWFFAAYARGVWRHWVTQLPDECIAANADRYRYLRDQAYYALPADDGMMIWCVRGEGCSTIEPIHGRELDDEIDARLP